MQTSKSRNYQERPKRKKPNRPNPEAAPSSNNQQDIKRKNKPSNYNRRADDPPDVYYPKSSNLRDQVFIYKQDLLQRGFDVFVSKKTSEFVTEITERFPECFETIKRKVILDNFETIHEEPSGFSQSRIHMRDELREDMGHLIDNEEIPDWFLESNQTTSNKPVFDFGNTVSRTLLVNKEISKRVHSSPLKVIPGHEFRNEVNFDELDKILEEKYIKSKVFFASDEEEDQIFELELESLTNKEGNPVGPAVAQENNHDHSYSLNESADYFNDLQNNIKKMLFNDKHSASEDEKDSEESFQESLGFEAKRESRAIKGDQAIPQTYTQLTVAPTLTLIQDLKSSIRPVDVYMLPPNIMSVNRALCNSLNSSLIEQDSLNTVLENDETLKLTPAERETRHNHFMDKYGYLDPIMCTLCYEILHSKKRGPMNQHSANGFNQKSVEKYCSNKYKIFSMFMQGDIITKVWLYKDKLGMIQGPFMSYDMDIWNGETNYFSDDLLVSLDNSPFVSVRLWVNRSNVVLRMVDEFMRRSDELKKRPVQNTYKPNNENGKYDKKFSFQKKNENELSLNQKQKSPEELTKNFTELFPTLDETEKLPAKIVNKHKKEVNSAEQQFIDSLKSPVHKNEVEIKLHEEKMAPKIVEVAKAIIPVPKKDEKTTMIAKKEPENEAKVEPKKALVSETENKKNTNSGQTNNARSNVKKNINQNEPRKETATYVKKEATTPKEIAKVAEKNPALDQEKTANIKNLLGLNF